MEQENNVITYIVKNDEKHKKINYSKWAYIFLVPFFVGFLLFQLIPLFETIYYSFFEYYYKLGLTKIGPNWAFLDNYAKLLSNPYFWKYLVNTLIIWLIGAIPQFSIALLLAVIFTDLRLKLRLQWLFKPIIYMPNLVMASAFGMLFMMFFDTTGPVYNLLNDMGLLAKNFSFIQSAPWVRIIIAFINFLMWFGNTTLLLMSGILGIDESTFESARIDGAGSFRVFKDMTIPLLMPIFVYTLITSMIGGIQLFDTAQIFTSTTGGPDQTSYTIMMYLYNLITGPSRNYGMAGALSSILFIVTAILSVLVFKTLTPTYNALKAESKARKKREKWVGIDVTTLNIKEVK
jgi:multiple sugar transport system permease protein